MTTSFPTKALEAIIEYLWCDEESDYASRTKEEKRDHIFVHLFALDRWLTQHEHVSPASSEEVEP